nr:uncharacterized protein LOC113816898 isoform X1 [Penaeus vannamei]
MCFYDEGAPLLNVKVTGKGYKQHANLYAALAVPGCKLEKKKKKIQEEARRHGPGPSLRATKERRQIQPDEEQQVLHRRLDQHQELQEVDPELGVRGREEQGLPATQALQVGAGHCPQVRDRRPLSVLRAKDHDRAVAVKCNLLGNILWLGWWHS